MANNEVLVEDLVNGEAYDLPHTRRRDVRTCPGEMHTLSVAGVCYQLPYHYVLPANAIVKPNDIVTKEVRVSSNRPGDKVSTLEVQPKQRRGRGNGRP